MRAALIAVLVVCFALATPAAHTVTFSAAVPAGPALAELATAEEALVALTDNVAAARLVQARGGRLLSPRLRIWRLPGAAAARLVPELERLGALRYAEPSRRRESLRFTDPLATPALSYHLPTVGADRAEPPGPGFPVTILDTGIDLTHPDFAARPDTIVLNPQFVSGPDGDDYHGTQVASFAAAAVNGVGGEGVYPQALLRILDLPDDLADTAVVEAIQAAIVAGPSVINLSFGGEGASRSLCDAVALASGHGSLVVAAAGNAFLEGDPTIYPAACPHVLTAGAIDRDSRASEFSSSGPAIDVTAPGEDLPFQDPRVSATHYLLAGTSFSAPLVSAAAAWVRTVRGAMTAGQLADLIRHSARDVGSPGFDVRTGYGVLDIPAALAAPMPARDPQEPNDDIFHVVTAGLFAKAKPTVSPRFNATVDVTQDPRDVYRVSVPRGRKLTVRVTSNDDVRVALFGPTTRTVLGTRNRVAVADRAGKQPETVVYTNRTARSLVLFLDISPGRSRTIPNPSYRVELKTAPAPR